MHENLVFLPPGGFVGASKHKYCDYYEKWCLLITQVCNSLKLQRKPTTENDDFIMYLFNGESCIT